MRSMILWTSFITALLCLCFKRESFPFTGSFPKHLQWQGWARHSMLFPRVCVDRKLRFKLKDSDIGAGASSNSHQTPVPMIKRGQEPPTLSCTPVTQELNPNSGNDVAIFKGGNVES